MSDVGFVASTLVTGATGFVGRRLVASLDGKAHVLTRRPDRADIPDATPFAWSPEEGPPPPEAFDGVDTVFHLAGEPVVGRWTDEKKRRIRDSRVLGTRHLVQAMRELKTRPKVLVSASAVGIYGERGDEHLDENASTGSGFLSEVCVDWEREAQVTEEFGTRVVSLRIGLVLGGGGALEKMLPAFRAGVGGRLGAGQHWMPWIHVDDVIGIARWAARDRDLHGPVNCVAPAPARNTEFTKALAKVVKRPAWFPVPKVALRIMMGEMSEILTVSQYVVPKVATDHGYEFRQPGLTGALTAAVEAMG